MKLTENIRPDKTLADELSNNITLEHIIEHSPRTHEKNRVAGIATSRLSYDESSQKYFIQNPFNAGELICVTKSTVEITASCVGREVLVMFEQEDIYRPVITGVVQMLKPPGPSAMLESRTESQFESKIDNGERLVFNAEREIVLQCGKSSIHLTKAGKVIIRGSYVLSRSTGLNSIKGGAVSIN